MADGTPEVQRGAAGTGDWQAPHGSRAFLGSRKRERDRVELHRHVSRLPLRPRILTAGLKLTEPLYVSETASGGVLLLNMLHEAGKEYTLHGTGTATLRDDVWHVNLTSLNAEGLDAGKAQSEYPPTALIAGSVNGHPVSRSW